jgi:hypothetical protein
MHMTTTLSKDLISLCELPIRLRKDFGVSVGYSRAWRGVVDGRVPAERHNGKWYVQEACLPEIAAAFGYSAPTPPASPEPTAQPA